MQIESAGHGVSRTITIRDQERDERAHGLFEPLIQRIAAAAEHEGCTLADAVFHRLWTSSREVRDTCADARAKYFSGPDRTASSSFISASRAPGPNAIAIEVTFLAGAPGNVKRVVEFTPPRRYAHYAVVGSSLYLSGMAEEGQTLEMQFELSLQQIQRALEQEATGWSHVRRVNMFLEKGQGSLPGLKSMLRAALPDQPQELTFEFVDGLASPGKHFEIEAIAKL